MKKMDIINGPKQVPVIIHGFMQAPDLSIEEIVKVIENTYELGVTFYDHATCYTHWEAEQRFGDAFRKTSIKREDVIIQSKCGHLKNMFDWSKESILESVDGSLKRLQTDYLDVLLLHHRDVIFEPEEVADAFDQLYTSGKVRYFGVSNVPLLQIELLKKYVKQPLVFTQHQLLFELSVIEKAPAEMFVSRNTGLLDYCRLNDITIQTWSPLLFGFFKGSFIDPDFPELNKVLAELGDKNGVSKTAVEIAWLLRHPAKMQAILGTTNPSHLKDACDACKVSLTRQEWYQIYHEAAKYLP